MAAQSLDQQWQQYFARLNEAEKKSVLQMLKTFLQGRMPEAEEMGERISIEQYNREIEAAMARVESGAFYTQEEVETMAQGW